MFQIDVLGVILGVHSMVAGAIRRAHTPKVLGFESKTVQDISNLIEKFREGNN